MERKLLFLIILLLNVYICSAQNEFWPGFLTQNNGEKKYGLIDYRSNVENLKSCIFKKDSASKKIKYSVHQIQSFGYENEKCYERKIVNINNKTDTLFLECLISGVASLYYIHLHNKDYYFLEKDTNFVQIHNNNLYYDVELGSKGIEYVLVTERIDEHRRKKIRRSHQYKGVLRVLFQDAPEIYPKIENTDFNKEDLIEISKTYHEQVCPDEKCIVYYKKQKGNIWNFGIHYSTGQYQMFYDDRYFGDSEVNLQVDQAYSAGIFLQTANIDMNDRLFFQYALSYGKMHVNDSSSSLLLDNAHYTFDFEWIKNEFSALYKLRNQSTNPYLIVGFPVNFILVKTGQIEYHLHREIELDQKLMIGFHVGMGVQQHVFRDIIIFAQLNYVREQSIKNKRTDSFYTSGLEFTFGLMY